MKNSVQTIITFSFLFCLPSSSPSVLHNGGQRANSVRCCCCCCSPRRRLVLRGRRRGRARRPLPGRDVSIDGGDGHAAPNRRRSGAPRQLQWGGSPCGRRWRRDT